MALSYHIVRHINILCSHSLENQYVVPKALKMTFIPSILGLGTTKIKGIGTVVGATFMAPVSAIANSLDMVHANSGRYEGGPYNSFVHPNGKD
jgi:hypothetical protein